MVAGRRRREVPGVLGNHGTGETRCTGAQPDFLTPETGNTRLQSSKQEDALSNDTAVTKADGFTRPEPPREAPEGRHWEAARAGREWALSQPGKHCRYRGQSPTACGRPAVVVVTRGIGRPIPWNYCAEDAAEQYGVWIEDGTVMTWELKDGPAS
jgi:hypothetical protein